MKIKSYKELLVWQKAVMLATEVYKITETYPKPELYGIVQQMRRAAVSTPSNIAEGWSRNHRKEFQQFLGIAAGSSAELETQLLISRNLYLLKEEDHARLSELTIEVSKMLYSLSHKLTP